MNQDQFFKSHQEIWNRFDRYLEELKKRPGKREISLAGFPALYRRVCHHLAVARARAYSHSLTENLHRLVLAAHQRIYGIPRPLGHRIFAFLRNGFPQLVRAEWRYVSVSALLLFTPLVILLATVQYRPEVVYTVIQPKDVRTYESMYNPDLDRRLGREKESDSDFLMFGYYIRNNTSIGFQTFAGGMLAGLGTAFYLIFNGIYIGAVAGHLTAIGYHVPFWSFVSGHSAPELIAIVLSGAAGLRIGMAILAPGRRTRRKALRDAASVGVRIVYGAALLFLLAAFVEAFWSSVAWVEPRIKYLMGVVLWLLVLSYLGLQGRDRAA